MAASSTDASSANATRPAQYTLSPSSRRGCARSSQSAHGGSWPDRVNLAHLPDLEEPASGPAANQAAHGAGGLRHQDCRRLRGPVPDLEARGVCHVLSRSAVAIPGDRCHEPLRARQAMRDAGHVDHLIRLRCAAGRFEGRAHDVAGRRPSSRPGSASRPALPLAGARR